MMSSGRVLGVTAASQPPRVRLPLAYGRLGGLIAIVVAVLACSPGCRRGTSQPSPPPFALGPTGTTFEQIDIDGDGVLGFDAFHEGLETHYYFRQGLDLDGDRIIQPTELVAAFFELWDSNDDGMLGPDEWAKSLRVWFPDRAPSARFEVWDENGDGGLTFVELGQGFLDAQLHVAYDVSGEGIISTREVSEYLYGQWDVNSDGFVDVGEWPLRDD